MLLFQSMSLTGEGYFRDHKAPSTPTAWALPPAPLSPSTAEELNCIFYLV